MNVVAPTVSAVESKSIPTSQVSQLETETPVSSLPVAMPHICDEVLYLPILVTPCDGGDAFYYSVAMNDKQLALNLDCKLDLDLALECEFIKDITMAYLVPIDDGGSVGWRITVPNSNAVVDVRTSSYGIFASIFDKSSGDSFGSVQTSYSEVYDDFGFGDYFLTDSEFSDYEVSALLEHSSDSLTTLFSMGRVNFNIVSNWHVNRDAQRVSADNFIDELKQANKSVPEFYNWLKEGQCAETSKYGQVSIDTSQYFILKDEFGEPLSETFDTLPATLSERSQLVAKAFLL